jgi:hypothetical protein
VSSEYGAERQARQGQPPTFEAAGRNWTIDLDMPSGALFDMAERAGAGAGLELVLGLREMIVEAVIPEQQEELRAALMNRDRTKPYVPWGQIQGLSQQVIQLASGSPFGLPSASLPTQSRNGGQSKGNASSGGSTSGPPRRVKL